MDDVYMPTLDALRALKPKWRVSIGMMIMRAEHLELITPEQARRLWIAYSRRGWKRGEPLDLELPVEEPWLQRNAFELLITERVQDAADVLMNLPYPATDIEALACLQPGFVSEPSPVVRLLDFPTQRRADSERRATEGGEGGELVSFPKQEKRG